MKFDDYSKFLETVDFRYEQSMRQRLLKIRMTEMEIHSKVYEAILSKKTIYDPKNDRTFAFTSEGPIIIDANFRKGISIDIKKSLMKGMEEQNEPEDLANHYTGFAMILEGFMAANIDTQELQETKKKVFQKIKRLVDSPDEEKQEVAKQIILNLIENLEHNILKGEQTYPGLNVTICNEKEKSYYRNKFLSELLRETSIDIDFFARAGGFRNLSFEEFEEIYRKSNLFSNNELFTIIGDRNFFGFDALEFVDYYQSDKGFAVECLTTSTLARLLEMGKLTPRDVYKRLTLEEIEKLDIEDIFRILKTENFPKGTSFLDFHRSKPGVPTINSKFLLGLDGKKMTQILLCDDLKYKLDISSEEIINCYGKIDMFNIAILCNRGLVNSEDVIKICRLQQPEQMNELELRQLKDDMMLFYNLLAFKEMVNTKKINGKFIENFNYFLDKYLDEDERKKYFQEMLDEMKDEQDGDKTFIILVKNGLIPPRNLDYTVLNETIIEMYTADEITIEDFLELCNKGIIKVELLKEILTDEEIIEHFENGRMDYHALNAIKEREIYIKLALEAESINVPQIIELYSNENGLQIEELHNIFEGQDLSNHKLSEYIPNNISSQKVEELFMNYYISQDDLGSLVDRKIITPEQKEEFTKKMISHENYKKFFSGENREIVLIGETEGEPTGPRKKGSPKGPRKFINDPDLQTKFLRSIGFTEPALFLKGFNNTLNGYTVYPSEELGLAIFLNTERPGNATYTLTIPQCMYLLTQIDRSGKLQGGMEATKQELRKNGIQLNGNTEHVKVRNACRNWGKNVLDDMRKLSPVLDERIKTQSTYLQDINKIIQEIQKDYEERSVK